MMLMTQDIKPTIDRLMLKLSEMPEGPSVRRNLFEIAGFPRWENVNSNMLAFYLDKNQEHAFRELFFKSLLELLELDTSLVEGDYEVFREYKSIDLVIAFRNNEEETTDDESEKFDWAIIVENKIHHHLHNDLRQYWNSVPVKKGGIKIGLVLSPWGQKEKDLTIKDKKEPKKILTTFKNIRHRELTQCVVKNLPEYYFKSDDRHLLLLKEYIANIESMYMTKEIRENKDKRLSAFHENHEEIEKIMRLEDEMRDHVIEESFRAMHTFGFKQNNQSTKVKGKHFFKEEESLPDYFRFYFWYPPLVSKGELHLIFELHNEFIEFGKSIHENETFLNLFKAFPALKKVNGRGAQHYQLAYACKQIDRPENTGQSFLDLLTNTLREIFFDKENGFFWKCAQLVEELIKKENQKPTEA